VHDTWAARDLPVLDATVSLLEESYMVTVSDIAARTGLDDAAVARALEALDPVYVDFRKTTTGGDPTFWYVLKVTPAARQAVGQWPTAESLVAALARELTVNAQQEQDAERKGLLAYAARLVGDTLRDVSIRAAHSVLGPAMAATRSTDEELAPSGPSGSSGTSGASGTSGGSGTSGASGASRPSGLSRAPGSSGSSGVSGPSGSPEQD
jgi:hypothetical protein